jgi:hypothetical protein
VLIAADAAAAAEADRAGAERAGPPAELLLPRAACCGRHR